MSKFLGFFISFISMKKHMNWIFETKVHQAKGWRYIKIPKNFKLALK